MMNYELRIRNRAASELSKANYEFYESYKSYKSTTMRAVIQRVSQSTVIIEKKVHASIGNGMMVLLGIEEDDTQEDLEWLCGKIARLRIFDDADGVMNLAITDVQGEVLLISQFTLHASTKKGNRPSYIRAARPETAIPLYDSFAKELGKLIGGNVKTGIFGAMMQVSLVNDGPVTIIIDTKNKE
jgi:D-aminoacyl-tRNA deacylase